MLSTDFAAWREQATSFDLMVAYDPIASYSLVARDTASQTRAVWVTHDFWALSGARLALGRLPNVGERGVVVLTDAFFTARFQRNAAVVGSAVTINGQQVTILGVLPAAFRFELPAEWIIDETRQRHGIDVYRAMVLAPQERGGGQIFYAVGRLKPDVSIDRARTELEAIRARIVQTSPLPFLDRSAVSVAPLHERLIGEVRQALWILLAAVGFVQLIACTNIASLLLARSSARQKEAGHPRRTRGKSRATCSGSPWPRAPSSRSPAEPPVCCSPIAASQPSCDSHLRPYPNWLNRGSMDGSSRSR